MTFHLAVWGGSRRACDPTDPRPKPRTFNAEAVDCEGCKRTNEYRAAMAAKRAEAAE